MPRPLTAALLAALLLAMVPAMGHAESDDPLDYDISNGHFYTQANGKPHGESLGGFSLTDDLEVPFWSEFRRLGGVSRLGYPISHRFLWHGLITQVTQKAMLQWVPDLRQVTLVNLIDYLSAIGKEDWLQSKWMLPATGGVDPLAVSNPTAIMRLVADQPAHAPFRDILQRSPDALKLYGLPTSLPEDLGDVIVWRFQRTALQLWKVSAPGVSEGLVATLNVGEVIKEIDLLPHQVFEPSAAPAEEHRDAAKRNPDSRAASGAVKGLATWYGMYFQGRRMRNGEPYDLNDPRTTAANTFPLGSWLHVRNEKNGASIDVRVTDTGAFRYPIIVDLSYAAFEQLADPDQGVIEVTVQPLHRE